MGEFLQRLLQRKLVQWALAYVAFAFALLQGVDIVAQRFDWPAQIERLLIIALAIGFCVALVLAWYHGERGVQRVTGTELLIVALLLAIGGGLLWRLEAGPGAAGDSAAAAKDAAASGITHGHAPVTKSSVAVLPLTDESGDRDQQYFSDGLSEDLITALSQFAGLKVISRNSSFQFRNTTDDSKTIGDKLGVAHLLEGSVRRAGDMVRISAQLVTAADGSTSWSQRYDRPYTDLFALQDDITSAVATALRTRLLEGNGAVAQSDRPPSGNLDAWNAYSRGRFHGALIDPEDARSAIGSYEQAIAFDPRYARAYAGLSLAWTILGGTFLSGEEQRQAYVSARAAVDRALQLDADVATAHAARGLLLQWADLDWTGAEAEYRRASELAPTDGLSRFNLGRLLGTLGQPQQAIPMVRQSIAIDPRNSAAYYWLAWNLAATGRLQEAEEAARKAVELTPGKPFLPAGLAIIQIQRGDAAVALDSARQEPPGTWRDIALALALQGGDDRAAADAALKDLIAKYADGAAYQIAEVYGLRKDPDSLFTWLDRAWDTRDSGISRLLTDPFIRPYRSDLRFAAFCRKVGLPVPGEGAAVHGRTAAEAVGAPATPAGGPA
jgi:serine/threonine-protein kinase